MADFDEDLCNELAINIINLCPLYREREFLNALFKVIIFMLSEGGVDDDEAKGLFRHMYGQYRIHAGLDDVGYDNAL